MNLRDVLCWQDCVAHVPATVGWCQDGGGKVGEVGLDLGERSSWHDEALLGLGGVDNPRRRQGLRHHLQGAQMQRDEHSAGFCQNLNSKKRLK